MYLKTYVESNTIVQKRKISCWFFNIREETNPFISLNWGKILFKCSKCFQKFPNKLVVGLQIKIFKSGLSKSTSINLSCTSKVTFQSDYIFLTGYNPLTMLTISNFLHISPPNLHSPFTPSSQQMIMSHDSHRKLKSSANHFWPPTYEFI